MSDRDFFEQLRGIKDEVDELSGGDFHKLELGQNWFWLLTPKGGRLIITRQRHGIHICPSVLNGDNCDGCKKVRLEERKGNKEFAGKWKLRAAGYMLAIKKTQIKTAKPATAKILQVPSGVLNAIVSDMMTGHFNPSEPAYARPLCITKRAVNTPYKFEYTTSFGEEKDASKYLTEEFLAELPDITQNTSLMADTSENILNDMEGRKKQGKAASRTRPAADDLDLDGDDFTDDEELPGKAAASSLDDDKPAVPQKKTNLDDDLDLDIEAAAKAGGDDLDDEPTDDDVTDEEEEELLGGDEPEVAPEPPPKPARKPRKSKKAADAE